MSVFAWSGGFYYDLCTMKQRLWLSLITCQAYCIDKELYKAIDYLRNPLIRFQGGSLCAVVFCCWSAAFDIPIGLGSGFVGINVVSESVGWANRNIVCRRNTLVSIGAHLHLVRCDKTSERMKIDWNCIDSGLVRFMNLSMVRPMLGRSCVESGKVLYSTCVSTSAA